MPENNMPNPIKISPLVLLLGSFMNIIRRIPTNMADATDGLLI